MYAVLSPAKKLLPEVDRPELPQTSPELAADIRELVVAAKALSVQDLKGLMKLSDALATLNHERFQAMSPSPGAERGAPAALVFAGDTYLGLQASELTPEDLTWAQDHLGILSGLYGLLRPLDRMEPYRLEMGTRLATARGASLYDFWGSRLAELLDARLEGHEDPAVLVLASQEYFSAVDRRALKAPVVEAVFQEESQGQAKVIGLYAKRARGTMARWMVTERITRRDQLPSFAEDGYTYRPERSTPERLVFARPKPAPKRR